MRCISGLSPLAQSHRNNSDATAALNYCCCCRAWQNSTPREPAFGGNKMVEDPAAPDNDHARSAVQVAGIGASAGGVKALQQFFTALPQRVGAALVVIIHLDPDHQSELAQVIAA